MKPRAPVEGWVTEVLSLLGEQAVVLNAATADQAEGAPRERDVDCAVVDLDPLWPLRLGGETRLCQSLHYDLKGWYWVLDREGRTACLDTIADPDGLGRDSFPTTLLDGCQSGVPEGVRAAYLAAKRLRKGVWDQPEWARIGTLARQDPAGFAGALDAIAGPRLRSLLFDPCMEGRVPDRGIRQRGRRLQLIHRFRTPGRVIAALALGARREAERITRPTGLFVLLVGPDGSGKSTLAHDLPELCGGAFRRELRYHWRPEFLPRPGALVRREKADPTTPHLHAPRGRTVSLLFLGYYWVDYLLGGWLRIWPFRMRTGLFVNERGWWDMAVDPRRYRLDVPPWLVRALGMFLPRPDLALVLKASPSVLLQRGSELAEKEIRRQAAAWERGLPAGVRQAQLNASSPLEDLERQARDQILDVLEARALARLGAGWAGLPTPAAGRWSIPRGPRAAATAGLGVYQPTTVRGLVGWQSARMLALLGGLRLLPRGEAPPAAVRRALAAHLPARSTLAVAAMRRGRYVALIVDERGASSGLAKIAGDEEGAQALDREATMIRTLGALLPPPLSAPRIITQEPGLLLLETVLWRPRLRPWRLDEEVARALGAFFRAGATDTYALAGSAHGDCAPWNLLRTERGWVLVDWESGATAQPPFFDLLHYLIQSHTLLGRPSRQALLEGFGHGRGWVGRAVHAYAQGAGLPVEEASVQLKSYLRGIEARLLPMTNGERDGTPARRRLLEQLER